MKFSKNHNCFSHKKRNKFKKKWKFSDKKNAKLKHSPTY